ncbi:uncharacterized protein [Symphalangus syndactylus]|uniref:uncharacterized protein isoform X1 n=1 Tax=Symphalangus syndactylus TaxID=9590 RepID=UPI002441C63C|nr:uncharacterized protein LOC129479286 isoform X1 [Symphalangus syndactylus]
MRHLPQQLSLEPQRMDFQQVLECGFLASSRRQNSSRAFLLLRKLQLFPLQQSLDLSQPYECVWVLEEFFSRCCISALGCKPRGSLYPNSTGWSSMLPASVPNLELHICCLLVTCHYNSSSSALILPTTPASLNVPTDCSAPTKGKKKEVGYFIPSMLSISSRT